MAQTARHIMKNFYWQFEHYTVMEDLSNDLRE